MIIIPDKNIPRARFLMPIHKYEWRTPSLTQPKNCFGAENVTRFKIEGRISDGHVVWRGWFDDRDDFDAFLWAIATGSLKYERLLWKLPTPAWHPDLGEYVTYEFASVTYFTTAASNATWNVPSDWNDADNSGETIAGGGAGGGVNNTRGGGGGAGAYSKSFNIALTPGGTATYTVGDGGAGVAGANGGNGGDSWFNGTTLAGSSVGSVGGEGGKRVATGSGAGGLGGATTNGIGSTKYKGGDGANGDTTGGYGGGGGGAATKDGAGQNGSTYFGGNSGSGASGGSSSGAAGSDGTEYGTVGGGGGGAGRNTNTNALGGAGGTHGGGGGGSRSSSTIAGGAGRVGLIVITYEPFLANFTNIAMMGM